MKCHAVPIPPSMRHSLRRSTHQHQSPPTPNEQTLDAENYGDWETNAFAPEAAILEALAAVDGVSSIETQTFTFMEM